MTSSDERKHEVSDNERNFDQLRTDFAMLFHLGLQTNT